jgi:hypothetical protein
MQERPELPMISTSCTTKQIETLPEGIDRPVFIVGPRSAFEPAAATGEAWILHSPAPYCRKQIKGLRAEASSWTEHYREPHASTLIHIEFRR